MSDLLPDLLRHISTGIFTVFIILGIGVTLFGAFSILSSFLTDDPAKKRMGTGFVSLLSGGITLAIPLLLQTPSEDGSKPGHGATQPAPSSTDSPDPTPTPAPTPTGQQPEPISLPRFEHLETLWLIPLVLIVLFLSYLLVKKLVRDVRKAKIAKAARMARQARLEEKWKTITDRHRELLKNYLDAETDWDMLFNYPALTDLSVPTTAAMVRAMQAAADADDHRPENLDEDTDLSTMAYPKAVAAFGVAWDAALRHARKLGQSGIPAEERKQIRQIRDLLAIAEDTGATENERQMAYGQALSLIKKLRTVALPTKAMARIEGSRRLMLTR